MRPFIQTKWHQRQCSVKAHTVVPTAMPDVKAAWIPAFVLAHAHMLQVLTAIFTKKFVIPAKAGIHAASPPE